MERDLTGQTLGGWLLAECIGYGKSALVFRASNGDQAGAVKIFDRDLVERFGREAQQERVRREKSLVGKTHPNLIGILDAGEDTEKDLFFVVMALFPGKNLAEVLNDIPHDRVFELISQVAAAAEFLEALGLAHRDIKPENIGVSGDFSTAVLLDLGVLRPVGLSTITDQHGQQTFVGTLQYSPPELLHRKEEDSTEGWRAVTFYQLGGVLHDLLTRKPLFSDDLSPYAHLVETVSNKTVSILAPGAAPELRMLAQDCLVKDPAQRLALVTWDRFKTRPSVSNDIHSLRERIAQRQRSFGAMTPAPVIATGIIERRAADAFRNDIDRIIRDASKQAELPPFKVQTDNSTVVRLRIVFDPSRAHATTATFAVYVEGTVVDASGGIVHVDVGAAYTSESASLPAVAPSGHRTRMFLGVRADDVLAARLAETLLFALDATQEACAQSLPSTVPHWLAIPGGA